MREHTARVRAFELRGDPKWRVDEVYHMPLTGDDGWEVRVQSRVVPSWYIRLTKEVPPFLLWSDLCPDQ